MTDFRFVPELPELKLLTPAIHKVRPGVNADFISLVCEVHRGMCPGTHGLSEVTTCGWEVAEAKVVRRWTEVAEALVEMAAEGYDPDRTGLNPLDRVRALLSTICPL